MNSELTEQVVRFKHGSRGVVLVGGFLMVSGAGLIYTAFADRQSASGVSLYHISMGIILLLTGAKLAFGLERNEFNLSTRVWRSTRGLFRRTTEQGTFDDLDAVVFYHQKRRHGMQYYDSYHVGVSRTDGDELHVEQTTSREYAVALARELATRLRVQVVEQSEESYEESGEE